MSGEVFLAIVTAICTMIVTIVTVIVRADVNRLKAEISDLRATVASAHALILQQNGLIQSLTAQKNALVEDKVKTDDTAKFTPAQITEHLKKSPYDL